LITALILTVCVVIAAALLAIATAVIRHSP